MKVQLSQFFEKEQSPLKSYLSKVKQEQKQSRERKISLHSSHTRQNREIVNPFSQQLQEHKPTMTKTKTLQSKAYTKMKNYMNKQQIKLKHIRLEDLKSKDKFNSTWYQNPQFMVSSQELKAAIPSVNDFFKNQSRDTMIYENSLLNDLLENRVVSVDNTVKSLQLKKSINRRSVYIPDNQPQIDKTIAVHKQKNKKLLNKLLKQKTEMKSGIDLNKYKDMEENMINSNFSSRPESMKRIKLKGMKTISMKSANQTRSVSPSIALLYELRNLSQTQLKKQIELDAILKNQHQNRERNLDDKANYYSDSVELKRINASTMFKTRKVMNERLLHRLKVSKDQGNHFTKFMLDLKESRVIICPEMQKILEEIRVELVNGKILREQELNEILKRYEDRQQLRSLVNIGIINKIKALMI